MRIQTGMLTVNAAFLQDLKDDNIHLKQLLAAIRRLCSGQRILDVPTRQWVDLLTELRDQLATHFALEEFFGYFDDATDAAPRLATRADVLRHQHETLFQEICGIVDDAECCLYGESPGTKPESVAQALRDFERKLSDHEENENELILDALYEDIGVGD